MNSLVVLSILCSFTVTSANNLDVEVKVHHFSQIGADDHKEVWSPWYHVSPSFDIKFLLSYSNSTGHSGQVVMENGVLVIQEDPKLTFRMELRDPNPRRDLQDIDIRNGELFIVNYNGWGTPDPWNYVKFYNQTF